MFLFRRQDCQPAEPMLPPAEPASPPPAVAAAGLDDLVRVVERDIARVSDDLAAQNVQGVEHGRQMHEEAVAIAGEARVAAGAASQVSQAVAGVAASSGELAVAGQEIARQAAGSTAQARDAVERVGEAAAAVRQLHEAASGIGDVLRGIADIAGRTNLLALNATIEAARAGEAGRGFAVVAGEVKSLATQTKTLTEDIGRRVARISQAAQETGGAIESMAAAVRSIDSANASVAASVAQQDATLAGISRTLQEAAQDSLRLSDAITAVAGRAGAIDALSARTIAAMAETTSMIDDLGADMIGSLRTAAANGGRSEARTPVEMPATLRADGVTLPALVLGLSNTGALLRLEHGAAAAALAPKGEASLDLPRIGRLEAERVGGSAVRLHVRFTSMPPAAEQLLAKLLDDVTRDDRRFIDAAIAAAAASGSALERALAAGDISERDLFEPAYALVPDSDPPQHMTKFTLLTDRLFPPIQEPVLQLDQRIAFAAAVDRNGYLPTHNTKYSHPQRPHDPVWNAANSRNRRIFNDRAGLAAGRCSGEYLLQTYERDMGGGKRVMLKEADAPIKVRGRAWGGFRVSYRVNA